MITLPIYDMLSTGVVLIGLFELITSNTNFSSLNTEKSCSSNSVLPRTPRSSNLDESHLEPVAAKSAHARQVAEHGQQTRLGRETIHGVAIPVVSSCHDALIAN